MTHGNFDALRMLSAVPQLKPREVTPPPPHRNLADRRRNEPHVDRMSQREIKRKNPVAGPDG